VPGESVGIYELLRILAEAAPIHTVPGVDRAIVLRSIDDMERLDIFGQQSQWAEQITRKEVTDDREKEHRRRLFAEQERLAAIQERKRQRAYDADLRSRGIGHPTDRA